MYVYWIRRKNFKDPYTEGYIGVTEKTLEERFTRHSKYMKGVTHVSRAIKKYDDVEIVLLHENDVHWCLDKEIEYRPSKGIGWNNAEGGGLPPKNVKGSSVSKRISQTLKDKGISPYSENTHSPEARAKRVKSMTGRKWFYDPTTLKSGLLQEAPTGWKRGRPPILDKMAET